MNLNKILILLFLNIYFLDTFCQSPKLIAGVSSGYNFKLTNSVGILKKNSLNVSFDGLYELQNNSKYNFNIFINASYPIQIIDSNKIIVLLSIMPGISYKVDDRNTILFNAGIVNRFDSFKETKLSLSVDLKRNINSTRKSYFLARIYYSSYQFMGIHIGYLFDISQLIN